MWKRTAPLVALALLSALTAEFLLGDQYLSDAGAGQQVGMLVFFMAFYGTGAILIRETVRRLHLGWPSILLLGFAFGVFEEGLLTQSLFDPNYVGQHLLEPAYIPALGIGAEWTVFVVALHVIWSIGSPIALFEYHFGRSPRLGRVGLAICGLLFALGSIGTFAISIAMSDQHFLASPMQLVVAALIVVAAIVVAVRLPRRAAGDVRGGGVVVGFVVTTLFQLAAKLDAHLSPWIGTVAMIAVLVVGAVIAGRFRPVSLAAGAILTYCWVGFRSAAEHGWPAMVEQGVIVAAYLILLVLTLRRPARPTIDHALHTGDDRRNQGRRHHPGIPPLAAGSGQAGVADHERSRGRRDRVGRRSLGRL